MDGGGKKSNALRERWSDKIVEFELFDPYWLSVPFAHSLVMEARLERLLTPPACGPRSSYSPLAARVLPIPTGLENRTGEQNTLFELNPQSGRIQT